MPDSRNGRDMEAFIGTTRLTILIDILVTARWKWVINLRIEPVQGGLQIGEHDFVHSSAGSNQHMLPKVTAGSNTTTAIYRKGGIRIGRVNVTAEIGK